MNNLTEAVPHRQKEALAQFLFFRKVLLGENVTGQLSFAGLVLDLLGWHVKRTVLLMRRNQTCLSWGKREREKSVRALWQALMLHWWISHWRLVQPLRWKAAVTKKLIDTQTVFAALLLPREVPYPSSVKHYVNMFNPTLKSLPHGYGLSAPNPFILLSLNPGKAWLETSALKKSRGLWLCNRFLQRRIYSMSDRVEWKCKWTKLWNDQVASVCMDQRVCKHKIAFTPGFN